MLVCTTESHRKPSGQSIVSAVRKWIPSLSVPGLAARLSANSWMRPACERAMSTTEKPSARGAELIPRQGTRSNKETGLEDPLEECKTAERTREVTVQPEKAAVAVTDTGGSGFSGYRARATFPCCCRTKARHGDSLHVAHQPASRRPDPGPV